jgi:hypothetical protein
MEHTVGAYISTGARENAPAKAVSCWFGIRHVVPVTEQYLLNTHGDNG